MNEAIYCYNFVSKISSKNNWISLFLLWHFAFAFRICWIDGFCSSTPKPIWGSGSKYLEKKSNPWLLLFNFLSMNREIFTHILLAKYHITHDHDWLHNHGGIIMQQILDMIYDQQLWITDNIIFLKSNLWTQLISTIKHLALRTSQQS